MSKRRFLYYIVLPIFTAVTVSCGSGKVVTVTNSEAKGKPVSTNQTITIPAGIHPRSEALLSEAKTWLGTPYKYGGTDKVGVDCSGLVWNVYQTALDIKLPRNSKAQSEYCTPINKKNLIPGDLLFFSTTKGSDNVSHVGIFIGDGRMIHSSASKGVIISDIDADYYVRNFAGAGSVAQYHAMLATPVPDKKQEAPGQIETAFKEETPQQPLPQTQINDTPAYQLTPVKSLPQKAATTAAAAASAPVTTTVITPAEPSNSEVSKELTPQDARMQVLNSIIEQKIDSIYNNK